MNEERVEVGLSRRRLFPAVPALVLLAACAHRPGSSAASSLPASEYYPLAVGNRWTYETNFLGEKRALEVEIQRKEDGFFIFSSGERLTADAYGIRDDRRYLLREPLEVGRSWTNVVSVSSVERYKVLGAGASCEVPAGRFEQCVVIEARNRVNPKTTLVNELTFAPRVGLVRVVVVAETDGRRIPQTEHLLRAFELQPSEAP